MKKANASADVSAPDAPAREVAAVWVPIGELHVWKDNPRKNDGEPVKRVAESIKRFGFSSPIVARTNGEIIAGHTRYKAAQTLKLDRVPVRFLDLDPAEAHLLALADNKLNEFAEWNDAQVATILSGFGLPDADLAGWTSAELDKLASAFTALPADIEEAFGALPAGDREPFQQMTFTLHDSQAQIVKAAISLAIEQGPFDGPNKNSNGNALTRVCEIFVNG